MLPKGLLAGRREVAGDGVERQAAVLLTGNHAAWGVARQPYVGLNALRPDLSISLPFSTSPNLNY